MMGYHFISVSSLIREFQLYSCWSLTQHQGEQVITGDHMTCT